MTTRDIRADSEDELDNAITWHKSEGYSVKKKWRDGSGWRATLENLNK